ncbi:MAG: right-handed parallel beta-helix repeat-containing protein, partial [Methanophagales archaeon]|nr:right-handed parallel beta-helix repeat-containing protein [Methanophagales archaeon]
MNVEKVKNILFAFALLLVFAVSVSFVGISSAAATIYVPDDYSLIQDAVNAATEGDTIVVRSNTYFENVVVNKPLSLVGEGMPTIDAQRIGSAIEITADDCEVKGFRCVNAKHPGNAGITVMSENNIIENNTCEENNYGISFSRSSNNTISNNICIENCNDGISLWDSLNNTISDNICIENCNGGIYLWRSSN